MKKILQVDPRIHGKHADLVDEPIIIRVNDFQEETAKKFSEEMTKAHNTGQPVIPVVIDSYGGYVYSLLSMISDIENARLPVATIAIGKAMSCGSFLLGFGTPGYRYADPGASVMIHDMSGCSWGKVEEMKSHTLHVSYLHKKLFQKLAKYCGHKDADHFLKKIHEKSHAEWFLTAAEAKKQRLVDHVKVPELKTVISLSMSFE